MAAIRVHEVVAQLLDPPKGGVVLDVGAGEGAFTQWLAQHGYRVSAVGIEPSQFRFAGAPFIQANVDHGLPVLSGSVEGVVAIELIEHLEEPLRFFREAARCLSPRGWMVISTPNVLSLSSKLSLVLRNYPIHYGARDYDENGHISPLSRIAIQRIAGRAGLSIEATTYNVGKVPIPRLQHRFPLTHRAFLTEAWGESLIMRLRKTSTPAVTVNRG
jgi:SAM-dependent methyltransferase